LDVAVSAPHKQQLRGIRHHPPMIAWIHVPVHVFIYIKLVSQVEWKILAALASFVKAMLLTALVYLELLHILVKSSVELFSRHSQTLKVHAVYIWKIRTDFLLHSFLLFFRS
jgi:hypothetical protein